MMYRLRPIEKKDLDLILEWRNHPNIRKHMFTTHIISKKEHYAYFEKVWDDSSIAYFICETTNNKPVGVVNFTKIDMVNRNAFWAFYSGNLNQRGVGTWMEFLALNHAFGSLDLLKLNCEVLGSNQKVLNFHHKFGFKIEGVFAKHHKVEKGYADVYRLAIFRNDWVKYQRPYFEKKLHGG
jgi:UDP-4-amino-4,6-dideoxy-N-acetyl-beta-L-altrosamine N-acetyltransferase